MVHIHQMRTQRSRAQQAQAPQWLGVAGALGGLVNAYAMRTDLAVTVADDVGHGAPACFIPATAEIEIAVSALDEDGRQIGLLHGVDPSAVKLATEEGRLAHLALVGAAMHEAGHARHSMWESPGVSARILDVMEVLEESRIEHLLLADHGAKVHRYLSACALEIVVKDFEVADTVYGASVAAALTLARVDTTLLQVDDVAALAEEITARIGTDTVAKLRPIWTSYQRIRTARYSLRDTTQHGSHAVMVSAESAQVRLMVDLARQWLDVIKVNEWDETDDLAVRRAGGSTGKRVSVGALPGMIEQAAADKAVTADTQATRDRAQARTERELAEAAVDAARAGEHVREAVRVFASGHGLGDSGMVSRVCESRVPTAGERRAAVALAQQLERAQYQERGVAVHRSAVPSGRLHMRAAMAGEAERARGAVVSAEPWVSRRRVSAAVVPLRVGLMCDVSGSMAQAQESMGVLGWMLPQATARIDAMIASVVYGCGVYGVVQPGQQAGEQVHIWEAKDGYEAFKQAFSAIDGELQLLAEHGARLLVIASDGRYSRAQDREYANLMLPKLRSAGVAVLWLDFYTQPNGQYLRGTVNDHGYGTVVPVSGLDAVEVAQVVGARAVAALARASSLM